MKFKGFTRRSLQTITLAQEEARRFGRDYLGTEHLLLALLRERDGMVARILVSTGITLDEVRERIWVVAGHGEERSRDDVFPFTPRSKKVLKLARRESSQLAHVHTEPEHLFLGLLRESEGAAARVLSELNVVPDEVRLQVLYRLGIDEEDPFDQVERRLS